MEHSYYMNRAITLAKNGLGHVNPNPLVGCVIVKNGKIIGEGAHLQYGGNHAEINALENATENVQGATMYVTLEPCAHYGKTPPCSIAVVKSGVKEVYIAMEDPNPKVAGKGVAILKGGGVTVHTGLLKAEALGLNQVFLKYMTTGLPYVAIKYAMTLDGKIATATGDSKWITGEEARGYVHTLRSRYMAILAGTGTYLTDNPALNVRNIQNARQPIRIVLDAKGRIPLEYQIFNTKEAPVLYATTDKCPEERIRHMENSGIEVLLCPQKDTMIDLGFLFKQLGEKGVDSILAEGGGTLLDTICRQDLADKAYAFIGPKILGGKQAKTPVDGIGFAAVADGIHLKNITTTQIEEDILVEGDIHVYGDY